MAASAPRPPLSYTDAVAALLSPPPADHYPARCRYFSCLCPQWLARTRVVHVSGTKGKGSACELLRSCGVASGRVVGCFTSPHLHTVRERIRVGERLIPRNDLARVTASLLPSFASEPWMLFFDRLLAVALKWFEEQGVQLLVLEVGVGGRYDSTNFVPPPALCVVTSISLDHQGLLGDTIQEVAHQKAGIIKHGCGGVVTPVSQHPKALEVLLAEASNAGVSVTLAHAAAAPGATAKGSGSAGDVGSASGGGCTCVTTTGGSSADNSANCGCGAACRGDGTCRMHGSDAAVDVVAAAAAAPQWALPENAAVAATAAALLGLRIDFEGARWPARYEVFSVPAVCRTEGAAGGGGGDGGSVAVVVDGAHNGDSVCKLVAWVKGRFAGAPVHAVFGAAVDKNVESMLSALLPEAAVVTLVASHNRRAATVSHLRILCGRISAGGSSGSSSQLQHPTLSGELSGAAGVHAGTGATGPTALEPTGVAAAHRSATGQGAGGGAAAAAGGEHDAAVHISTEHMTVADGLHSAIAHTAAKECSAAEAAAVVVVCGSLYVAAEARAALACDHPCLFDRSDWVFDADG